MNNTNYKETENFPLVATPLKVIRNCPECGHHCDPDEIICHSCGAGSVDKRVHAKIDAAYELDLGVAMERAANEFNKTLEGFYVVNVYKGFCFGYQFFIENIDDDGTGEAAEEIEKINKWLEETAKRLGLIVIR